MSNSLPASEIRALIHPYVGDVTSVERTARGFSSDVTALVDSEKGAFFIKAVRNRPGGRFDSITREMLINPFVRPLSPALRWYAEDEHWVALDWPETRWDRFARNQDEAELFKGDALLHTDVNPSNFLIGVRDMWVVDWAWPTRGAAFIDPAMFVVQLVAAGHSPESAESWASRSPSWTNGDPRAVDAFAAAFVRMYRAFAARKPEASWLGAMAEAARSWADHRGVMVA